MPGELLEQVVRLTGKTEPETRDKERAGIDDSLDAHLNRSLARSFLLQRLVA